MSRSLLQQPNINLKTGIDDINSDMVLNESIVTGDNVTDALDHLQTQVNTLDSGDIANTSGVTGASVTNALNTLNALLTGLGSDDIANESIVVGTNVSDALDTLRDASNIVWVSGFFPDINVGAAAIFIPAPITGRLTSIKICVTANPGTTNVFTASIGGVLVTNGSVSVGGAEGNGVVKTATPTANNNVVVDTSSVKIETDAGAGLSTSATIILGFTRP